MAQKQHEALDEGDLDQDVAQTHRNKIKQRKRRLAGVPGPLRGSQYQGQNQK